jgi:hypothetical protein
MTEQIVSIHRRSGDVLAASARLKKPPKPTREYPLIISASELRDFLRCRVKWHWRYQERLVPLGEPEALAIGSLVHEILEHWYLLPPAKRGPKSMNRIVTERIRETTFKELTTDNLELIRAMTLGYAPWAQVEDREIGLVNCTPEGWFEEDLVEDGSIRIRGKIDNSWFPTTMKKTVACQETKTAGQFKDQHLENFIQGSVYLWALRKKHPNMRRYVLYYTQLRKQMPGPRVRSDLFRREMVERTDYEIDQWALDTARAALDMLDAAIYPTPDDSCSWSCDYKMPCLIRGRADDLADVLSTQFKRKENR